MKGERREEGKVAFLGNQSKKGSKITRLSVPTSKGELLPLFFFQMTVSTTSHY
jgi:hypothetical protein